MDELPPLTTSDRARAWGRALLEAPPWDTVADRVTLLVVAPPANLDDAGDADRARLWLSVDQAATRSLPPELARPLAQGDAILQHHRPHSGDEGPASVVLAITTHEAADRLLQGLTPAAMEARWQVRHATAVADRLHRLEQYQVRAGMLPEDGLERVVRALWVAAASAARGLDGVVGNAPTGGLPAAGECAASLCRLACVWDEGAYAPAEYLRVVARETRIGRRIDAWLDDFVPALTGDEAATRRILGSRDQALHEVRQVLAERFRNRPWLTDPEATALRAPR